MNQSLPLQRHKQLGWFLKETLLELAKINNEITNSYGKYSFTAYLASEAERSLLSFRQEMDSLVRAEHSDEPSIKTIYYGPVDLNRIEKHE